MLLDTYRDAREAFLRLAQGANATLDSHVLPGHVGRFGETLAMDVATFGNPEASKALLIICGTHGLEGPPGSAVQLAFLAQLQAPLEDVKVVAVHALNPWGFSHGSRADAENIDVNRNFVDFTKGTRENPAYTEFHPYLCPALWRDDITSRLQQAAGEAMQQKGVSYVLSGLTTGQYSEPTGLNYGGKAASWSNLTIEKVVRKELGGCNKIGFIEWHSGLGTFGDLQFINSHPPESHEHARVVEWWGPEAAAGKGASIEIGQGAPLDYSGLLADAIPGMAPHASVAGAVIEFGTYGNQEALEGLMLDRWLKFGTGNNSRHTREELDQRKVEMFYPRDEGWRTSMLGKAMRVQTQALSGMQAW